MELRNKKEFDHFIKNMDEYSMYLINSLNEYGILGKNIDDFEDKIETIQHYFENEYSKKTSEIQNQLRLGFWAFFSKLLLSKLGGELRIAPKNDYCEGTPQLINFGNRIDKKGKKNGLE